MCAEGQLQAGKPPFAHITWLCGPRVLGFDEGERPCDVSLSTRSTSVSRHRRAPRASSPRREGRAERQPADRKNVAPPTGRRTWRFSRRERGGPLLASGAARARTKEPSMTTTATPAGSAPAPHRTGLTGALARRWPTGVGIAATAASLAMLAPLPERVQIYVSAWSVLLAAVIYLTWGTA